MKIKKTFKVLSKRPVRDAVISKSEITDLKILLIVAKTAEQVIKYVRLR